MAVYDSIRSVFGHFQNLNLLFLMQDLRDGHVARHAWLSWSKLCPVAHGLPDGEHVKYVVDSQFLDLDDCVRAARFLGADPAAVEGFVRMWDGGAFQPEWLLRQLEELWLERLEDAVAVQAMLAPLAAPAAQVP